MKKYLPKLAKKLNISREELNILLEKLPLLVYKNNFYNSKLKKAKDMIAEIDEKDMEILSLALKLETYLWSQDKDFERCGYSKLLKTYNFIG